MNVLFLSPDFDGHKLALFAMRDFIKKNYALIMNIHTEIITYNNSDSNDPKKFIFDNITDRIETLNNRYDFSKINLIIYDFFAIEGIVLAKKYKIKTICSIPAIINNKLMTNFDNLSVLNNIKYLDSYYNIQLPKPKYVSDGFLLEGDKQIVWNYLNIVDEVLLNNKNYYFVGSKLQFTQDFTDDFKQDFTDDFIYCSLGTVVAGYMYDIGDIMYKQKIIQIFEKLMHIPYKKIIISCPDKIIAQLKSIPSNVQLINYCDQNKMLKNCKLFVTHGGGNSFNESIYYKKPMVVIPFFGDQFATSDYVNIHNLGFGYSNCNIEDLYDKIIWTINNIKYDTTNSTEYNKFQVIKCLSSLINKNIFANIFTKGDLLYGTTEDRIHFQNIYELDFQIGHKDSSNNYLTFDKLTLNYPVLIDQWNDLLRTYNLPEIKSNSRLEPIKNMLILYKKSIVNNFSQYNINDKIIAENKDLLLICCHGLEFFLNQGYKIHFVINKYNKIKNIGTALEMEYLNKIREKYNKQLLFWIYDDTLQKYVIYNLKYLQCNTKQNILDHYNYNAKHFETIKNNIDIFIDSVKNDYVIWFQSRLKKLKSINDNIANKDITIFNMNDIIGFRIIYPWSKDLHTIADAFINYFNKIFFVTKDIKENGKVIYLFCIDQSGVSFEIQLWPTIMYTCFEYEHDKLYKCKNINYTNGQYVYEEEHKLQNIIDQHTIINK